MALANRDQPTLERPGRTFNGNALYFTFGLEGVNNDTGYNTREDLLGAALHWAWDTATASIEAKPMPNGQVSYFTAKVDSTFGGDGVTFRWDFGDGTPFTNVYTSATAGHTYAAPGAYTVRVEATNGLGTRVIGETTATVLPEFNTPASATFSATGRYVSSQRRADDQLRNGAVSAYPRRMRRASTTCGRCWPSMYPASRPPTLSRRRSSASTWMRPRAARWTGNCRPMR